MSERSGASTLALHRDTVRAVIAETPGEAGAPTPVRPPAHPRRTISAQHEATSLLERTRRPTEERPRRATGAISPSRDTHETVVIPRPIPEPRMAARTSDEPPVTSAPAASHASMRLHPTRVAAALPVVFAAGTGLGLWLADQAWDTTAIGAAASLLMTAAAFAAGAVSAHRSSPSEHHRLAPATGSVPEAGAGAAASQQSLLRTFRTRKPSKPRMRPVAHWTEEHGEPAPAVRPRMQAMSVGTLQVVKAEPAGLTLIPAENGAGWRWQWGPAQGAEVQRLSLANGGVYTIGTGERCDVRLPATEGASISHAHARITIRRGRVLFHHIGEEGESSVNGERAVWAVLEPGDTIGIGPYRCHLLAPAAEGASS